MRRWAAAWAAGALFLVAIGSVRAGDVYCGSFRCFVIRASHGNRSAETRSNLAMDVLNKYLGGRTGKFDLRTRGQVVDILLNGDVVVTVTPADARAAQQRSVRALANAWRQALARAFEETKAQK